MINEIYILHLEPFVKSPAVGQQSSSILEASRFTPLGDGRSDLL